MTSLINPNPVIKQVDRTTKTQPLPSTGEYQLDAIEVFDLIREIKDPEHPFTLEELMVVQEDLITVKNDENFGISIVQVTFVPTVPHCTLASLIGLCIREKLSKELPPSAKIDVYVSPGTHQNESDVNKQINDKERVHAALENPNLYPMILNCIKTRE
mmetsp:Transcript_11810/g.15680  ORF Transcript_11810/g.15680 Transcript_11810/m.15680 type:complete len:158 (+) Transcript_11810:117-590(+)|eukprot:CAMPEP_0201478038 /NCGR_PEP_ID=MMETSP0151_2-20130828/2962_1 /ASSEMBLY_ACC=CAM_ASM_000257 /TAXON_ID=200890 /ORGANISM="Paramoeba atlantica, Strain 621/1 / CCAP 1560/9" /LENGTH=157 /DNA_ID=CAMNT_0047858971 /DNA_START=104 /DNA_END=577 /DNA_ORIENTATION=+